MKKFYEKSELWFSITWIIIYVAIMGNLRNNFGDESIFSLLGVLIIAAILTIFILKNDLKEKYFKIKECLSRCGNDVIELNNKYLEMAELK